MKMPLDECCQTLLMKSQYWFRKRLGGVRQQAIIWTSIGLIIWHPVALLGHNDLAIRNYYMPIYHQISNMRCTLVPIKLLIT